MRLRLMCLGVAVFLLLGSRAAFPQGPSHKTDIRQDGGRPDAGYHGGEVTPPLPKPTFTLTDTSGAPFDFRERTDGYTTLLFFGYANCPDICPMHMALLASAIRKLPKDVKDGLKVVFVTTDPDRDDARTLRTWLDSFDTTFIGLTGSKAQIQAAQMAAHVPLAKSLPNYDHAAFVLAYTRDNLGHLIYPSGVSEAIWLHDLPRLAKETWPAR
jgi:protein SCO1/2